MKTNLSREEKVLASKVVKWLKVFATRSKSELKEGMENINGASPAIKDYLFDYIMPNIYM